jgi:capsular polysaccharide biosynthesis protein
VTSADLQAEQELDLGRLWSALVARWWLPAAGLVAGAILGYLVSLGGSATYQAQATIYLGQPLSPSGGAQIQSLATNPSTAREIAKSEATLRRVARQTGLSVSMLRSGTTVTAVAGAVTKAGQTPLVAVTVKGHPPVKIARAANSIASIVANNVSGYVTTKIAALKREIEQDKVEIASINQRIALYQQFKSSSVVERLLIQSQAGAALQRQSIVEQDLSNAQELLTLAQNVESSKVVTHAAPTKQTARSRRNALVVGAFIGLLIGLLAALLWEPAVRVARRPAA